MNKKGFTVIEMAVVISVISILSVFFFANYHGGESDFALKRSAHELAQDIRGAQEKAVGSQSFKGAYQGGYGISLNEGEGTYSLFVDCNEDGVYNEGALNCRDCTSGSCGPMTETELVETFSLEDGVTISNLTPDTFGVLSIVYLPPDPSVTFSPLGAEATISLKGVGTVTETVKINTAGLIEVFAGGAAGGVPEDECDVDDDCNDSNVCTIDWCENPASSVSFCHQDTKSNGTDCGNCLQCQYGTCVSTCSGTESSCQCIDDSCVDCSDHYGMACDHGTCGLYQKPSWTCSSGSCQYSCQNDIECGEAKENGVVCSASEECISGFCVDGVCCNSSCTGSTCQRCDSYSSAGAGTCGYVSTSVDPDSECGLTGCLTGSCSSSGYTCGFYTSGQHNCSTCQACNGSGVCTGQTTSCDSGLYGCTDSNKQCSEGSCVECIAQDSIVFISSQNYNGNMGGLAGADQKCQSLANTAGLTGTFKAWLSDSMFNANDRITHNSNKYVLVNDTIVANNWTDFADGSHLVGITLNETGGSPGDRYAYTGSTYAGSVSCYSGSAPACTCQDWATSTADWSNTPRFGDSQDTSSTWSQETGYNYTCSYPRPLYCIQDNGEVLIPTMTTQAATDIQGTTVTGNGTIVSSGGELCDQRGFRWGTSPGVYTSSSTDSGIFGSGVFTKTITGLATETIYYYQSMAHNSAGWGYGAEQSFNSSDTGDRYWIGGTGNWSDSAHWAYASGGAGGAFVPTANENVHFDANSFTSTGQTITISADAYCKDMDWTGVTNTPTATFGSYLHVYGSLTLSSGMTLSTSGKIYFNATSLGKIVTSAGKTLPGLTFDGTGGGWTFQDDMTLSSSSSGDITLTRGSLDTNSKTIVADDFAGSNSNTRALTLGSSTINLNGNWNFSAVTGLTFNPGSSIINLNDTFSSSFYGGGRTYNEVRLYSNSVNITGVNTFSALTHAGPSGTGSSLNFGSNQTISGLLTLSGYSPDASRLKVKGDSLRTITAGSLSASNVDFNNISGAGSANWNLSAISGGSGDCDGNVGITFSAPQTNYWVGNDGNWRLGTKWASTSGGTGGTGRTPLCQDSARFDVNSFNGAGQSADINAATYVKDVDWTGVINNPTFNFASDLYVSGSLTLASGMTLYVNSSSYDISFTSTSLGKTIDFAGISAPTLYFTGIGGGWTLQSDLTSSYTIYFNGGTFNANNKNVTAAIVSSSNSNTRTINMGSGTWTLTGTGSVWYLSTVTGLTLNPDTSTIKLTNNSTSDKTFYGGGKTYYNLWNATQGTGKVIVRGSNAFNDFKIDAGRTTQFYAGDTQTVTSFTAVGSSGNLITLESSGTSNYTLNKAGGGTVTCDYISVSRSTGTPASTWYATHSTDGGNNSGWSITP